MSRQNMTSSISVLLAGVIVIILLLASSDANTSAITRQQNAFQDDEIANAYPAGTASAYVPPANRTTVITGTAPITGTVGTGTSTAGGTHSPTPGTPTPTLTRSANPNGSTELPSEATQPDEAIATLSPTPIDAFTCTPGVPVEIAGDGPPRAPLLLYFDERPVGGGSVAPNGRFALKLIVGQERAGDYKVTVRVRGTSQSLRQVTCSVPNVTPTPPDEAIATLSPTPIDAFTCTPGVPVEIAGDGPPRAPLLLYFDERPVGGGSVALNGRFALKLIVGQERAGEYKVTVRVRGTSQPLHQVTCSVPNVTPTPLPGTLGR